MQVDHHARQARATDLNTLKDNIRDYVTPVTLQVRDGTTVTIAPPGEKLAAKHNLGFNSLWTARLLVPRSSRDEFDDDPQA